MDLNTQSSDQQNGAERGTNRANGAIDDELAFLSLDIVADVLGPHVDFEEAASMSTFNSCWGDLIRSCTFEMADVDRGSQEIEITFSLCGIQREYSTWMINLDDDDWSFLNITLNNVVIDIEYIEFEAVGVLKILRCATGNVTLKNAHQFGENPTSSYKALYDALAHSRARHVLIELSVALEVQPLLENPHLRSLELKDVEESFIEIVDFCLNLTTDKELTFRKNTYEDSTDFLVGQGFRKFDIDCECATSYEFGCACCCEDEYKGTRQVKIHHSIFQKIHTNDNTKVMSVLVQRMDKDSEYDTFKEFAIIRFYSHDVDVNDVEEGEDLVDVVHWDNRYELREELGCNDDHHPV